MQSVITFAEHHHLMTLGFVLLVRASVEWVLGIKPVDSADINIRASNLFYGDTL